MQTKLTNNRLESLDALRGFDMFFISGGATLLTAIAAFFPDSTVWQTIAKNSSLRVSPSPSPCRSRKRKASL